MYSVEYVDEFYCKGAIVGGFRTNLIKSGDVKEEVGGMDMRTALRLSNQ